MEKVEFAPEFPKGDDASTLWDAREVVRSALEASGYELTGAGMGVGPESTKGMADIGVRTKSGQRVEVRLYLLAS